MPKFSAEAARNALLDLLENLATIDIKKVQPNKGGGDAAKLLAAGQRPTPGRKLPGPEPPLSTTPEQWEETLRRAVAEIPEWCVSFSIDAPLKKP